MGFAERNGFLEKKAIQVDDIDSSLKNRLYNVVHRYLDSSCYINEELEFVVDKLGYKVESISNMNWSKINSLMLKSVSDYPWYMPYEIIEYFFEAKRTLCNECRYKCSSECRRCPQMLCLQEMPKAINLILEEEKSGYRFINDKFVNIVNDTELQAIDDATNTPYYSVNQHIQKALALYSDRKNPDYENSIKESISAVEAMCCIITGLKGSTATLGTALKKLEENGVIIHGALRDAFSKMYGYTSDADGIRHGGIDFKNSPSEDAKYMLISCSAFVNYLIEKHSKIGGTKLWKK